MLDGAAFGQTPASYESACIGVARANGLREQSLINTLRGFGAPVLLEVDIDEVREWNVSRSENHHTLVARHRASDIATVVARRAQDWRPDSLLRLKNLGISDWTAQLDLFSGLIPELENQIQEKLDPLLREALSETRSAYESSTGREADGEDLFKLVFWTLTAKVFHDRKIAGFTSLGGDADQIIAAVAKQHKTTVPRLLNREARQVAAATVWRDLDFRNLSVEVLAHIWSRTLVDRKIRKRLGIHRTPRAIVRHVVDRIPFAHTGNDDRIVFEPCSGSAAFLVGAVNALRSNLVLASPQERHRYFVRHLAGMEADSFGREISMLALTLADFPNPNGWDIARGDVFKPGEMTPYLRRSSVVLCNPPFEAFDSADRRTYGVTEAKKPAELLLRVLRDLPQDGVLGFVLPASFIDGRAYASTRRMLAERFSCVELTALPERSFEDAETEVAVLIAKEPIPHQSVRVVFRRVDDNDQSWDRFKREHAVSSQYTDTVTVDEAAKGLKLFDLPEVWMALASHHRLGDVAEIHRGIEWTTPIAKDSHVRSTDADGYTVGVAPSTKFRAFETPRMMHLDVRPKWQRRNSLQYNWAQPKAIVPKARVSRGPWRMASFVDRAGVLCYHAFYGVWPKDDRYDPVILAAILNSPVANAFVATREGNRDVTAEVLRLIPVPALSASQKSHLHDLVQRYEASIGQMSLDSPEDPEELLKSIDAIMLDGYHLSPRLERRLLDYFQGASRKVAHGFSDYFPANFDVAVSLSEYRSRDFSKATVGSLLRRISH